MFDPEQLACDRLAEHVRRRVEHQTAGGQADHPVAVAANEIERVQVADHGDAEMLVDPQQCIHDHATVGGVERGDRLIGKDEIGLLDERAGDSDALLLAAGQLIGPLRGKGGNVELLQCRHGNRLVLHKLRLITALNRTQFDCAAIGQLPARERNRQDANHEQHS